MRGSAAALLLAAAALPAGCGGEVENGVKPPPPPPLILAVSGTSCEGEYFYEVDGTPSDPDGALPADFPWDVGLDAHSGQVVRLTACNTCVLSCPILSCDVTITGTIYWKGKVLATQSATGQPDLGCTPAVDLSATLP